MKWRVQDEHGGGGKLESAVLKMKRWVRVFCLRAESLSARRPLLPGEMRSNLAEQKEWSNVFQGNLAFSEGPNQADKAQRISGPAGPCWLIIYWYVQRRGWGGGASIREERYTELIAEIIPDGTQELR